MGAWTNFLNWLKGSEDDEDTYYVEQSAGIGVSEAQKSLNLRLLMINTAIGYIAAGLNLCRWRLILNGREVQNAEYYRLNNCPNRFQNKSEFCSQLAYKLAFNNEALIISPIPGDPSLYIADNWNAEPHGTKGVIYRNITISDDDKTYTLRDSDVMHLKLNWTGVYPLLFTAANEYEQIIETAVTGYTKQAGERGILEVSSVPSGTPDQQRAYMNQLEDRFRKYFKQNNAVLPLQSGFKYSMNATAHRNTSEINDVINLTDEFAERVALALRVPVALMKGNVENTSHARTDLILYGIKPIATQIEQEYNAKRLGPGKMQNGSRLYIDPISIALSNTDDMAAFCDKMIACGQYSVDELRDLRGEPLLGTPEAQTHYITKNYGILGQSEDDTSASALPAQTGTEQNNSDQQVQEQTAEAGEEGDEQT